MSPLRGEPVAHGLNLALASLTDAPGQARQASTRSQTCLDRTCALTAPCSSGNSSRTPCSTAGLWGRAVGLQPGSLIGLGGT